MVSPRASQHLSLYIFAHGGPSPSNVFPFIFRSLYPMMLSRACKHPFPLQSILKLPTRSKYSLVFQKPKEVILWYIQLVTKLALFFLTRNTLRTEFIFVFVSPKVPNIFILMGTH